MIIDLDDTVFRSITRNQLDAQNNIRVSISSKKPRFDIIIEQKQQQRNHWQILVGQRLFVLKKSVISCSNFD